MLTNREEQSTALHSVGLTPAEIGEILGIEENTVRVNLRKAKDKINWHKATELSGYYICKYLGKDFSQVRKEIIESIATATMIIFFSFFLNPIDEMSTSRRNRRDMVRRGTRIEIRYRTESTA